MYDVDKLEREWDNYRRRRIMRYAGGTMAAVVLAVLLSVYMNRKTPSSAEANQSITKSASLEKNKTQGTEKAYTTALKSEVPSMHSSEKKSDSGADRKRPRLNIQVTDIPEDEKNGDTESEESDNSQPPKTNSQKREDVIKEMEKRFSFSKDYDEALYIARYYYAKRQYKKAERWAMEANSIDSKKEDSWIIFGKAKAKQGDRVGSLKVLQAYFDRTGSEQAGELIDKIRKGNPF